MEETFIWMKGRGSFNDVLQAVTLSFWEVLENYEGAEQHEDWGGGGLVVRSKAGTNEAGEEEEKKCPAVSSSQPCLAGPPIPALERTSGGQPFC